MQVGITILCSILASALGTGTTVGNMVYNLGVKTSSSLFAGTDEFVEIQLVGDVRVGQWERYIGDYRDRFENNEYDQLRYETKNIGRLTGVNVRVVQDGSYLDHWRLSYIDVGINASTYRAFFHRTFKNNKEVHHQKEIIARQCAAGYQQIQFSRKVEICEDVDECQTTCRGPGEVCQNHPGEFSCSCRVGFTMIDGRCVDIDECQENSHHCYDPNSKCKNTKGSFQCPCRNGYERVGKSKKCTDINECASKLNNAHNCQQICSNTDGSYKCSCRNGWRLSTDNTTCIDADDCAPGKNPCDPKNSECFDLQGSYRCICKHGYKQIPNTQQCTPITCKAIRLPSLNVQVRPPGCRVDGAMKKGEKCYFSCKQGYELAQYSAKSYSCSKSGYFELTEDAYEPRCVPTLCPKISNLANGMVVPYTCTSSGMQHNGKCFFHCLNGYRLHGTKETTCSNKQYDARYNANKPICVEIPEIQCPDDITIKLPADKEKEALGMSFTEASTNMDSYQTNPKGVDAAYEFGLGTHKVEYIARNKYGDVAKCSYNVEVVDKSAPVVEFCPRDVFHEVKTTGKVRITWPEPRFKDNIGIKKISKNLQNGGMHSPSTFNVVYDAYDNAGNIATCIFQVHIDIKRCAFDQIEGGDQAISKACYQVGPRSLCSMFCNPGKTFHFIPDNVMMKTSWFCAQGDWLQNNVKINRLPDCVDSEANPSKGKCKEGYVNTYDIYSQQPACGKCPRGTRYEGGVCLPCSEHTYQDQEGQLQCKKCPVGKGSIKLRNKDITECKDLCPPGTYSRSGFITSKGCQQCPKDTYNENYGAIECFKCPYTTMTEQPGSKKSEHCLAIKDKIFTIPGSQEAEIHIGGERQVGCVVNSAKNISVSWVLPSNAEIGPNSAIESTARITPTPGKKSCNQYIASLNLKNVSKTMAGDYTCVVHYDNQPKEMKSVIDVKVLDQPLIPH
ncbi:signal peptide, CUB and EGF-like domain-containing protein 1 [Clytia hemisphaerica]